jgi:hypothetical protein
MSWRSWNDRPAASTRVTTGQSPEAGNAASSPRTISVKCRRCFRLASDGPTSIETNASAKSTIAIGAHGGAAWNPGDHLQGLH